VYEDMSRIATYAHVSEEEDFNGDHLEFNSARYQSEWSVVVDLVGRAESVEWTVCVIGKSICAPYRPFMYPQTRFFDCSKE
jgi:hypothetical protein